MINPIDPTGVKGWLLKQAWKIVSGLAVIGCIWLGVLLVGAKIELRHVNKVNSNQAKQITALNRDIAQCRTNQTTLQKAIDSRNAEIKALSEQGAARIAVAEKKVATANAETAKARRQAEEIMRFKPKGDDAGARMLDVDRKFVEGLK